MRQTRTIELGTGLFVLLGFAALFFLITQITSREFGLGEGGYRVTASFDQVGGLKPRAPVVIGGVKVGQVRSIGLDDELRARVVLDVDRGLELPSDTSAVILTAGVLGDQYVELSPGGETTLLQPGDEIQFKQDALVLERMIGRLIQNLGAEDEEE
jgi:phospholipid/cholesterol/gamma-HCH transport system substrate-binding protein